MQNALVRKLYDGLSSHTVAADDLEAGNKNIYRCFVDNV